MPGEAARLLRELKPHFPIRLGSLKVYGDWFGGREDNVHTAVAGEVDEHSDLVLRFDQEERLVIVEPRGCTFGLRTDGTAWLRIERAQKVRWEWYYYGRAHTPENLFVEEHWLSRDDVRATSTADWYEPSFAPSLLEPAVEFR